MKAIRCLVTGANSGIGKETAKALAGRGAEVLLLCRNPDKAEHARADIVATTGNQNVSYLLADLASQRQIRAVVESFHERFDRLDVLVNNAGMIAAERTLTEDGVESTLAVNHLGPFLLTNLLLGSLKRAPRARIVVVASEVHRWAKLELNNLQMESGYTAYGAYCLAKLANIMFTAELARRLEGTRATANSVHPGMVGSNLGSAAPWWFRAVMALSRPFLMSPERGAQASIHLAIAPELDGVSGHYFKAKKQASPAPVASDAALCSELWAMSEALTGLGAHIKSRTER